TLARRAGRLGRLRVRELVALVLEPGKLRLFGRGVELGGGGAHLRPPNIGAKYRPLSPRAAGALSTSTLAPSSASTTTAAPPSATSTTIGSSSATAGAGSATSSARSSRSSSATSARIPATAASTF